MNWDTQRKLIYALGFSVFVVAIAVIVARPLLFPEPTCFDKKQNGYEGDVDCGGVCSLMCTADVSPLTVDWAKALLSDKGMYDLVAMVNNSNIDNAAYQVGYSFTLYDAQGGVMGSLSGSTTAPIDGKFPLIIQNVKLPVAPASVIVRLNDGPHFKVQESPTSPTVRITDRRFENGDTPRVYATIASTKRLEITNLPVRVVLFDASDNAYAVGQTIVPILPKEGVRQVVITWGERFKEAPVRIGVYPIFNPFEALGY